MTKGLKRGILGLYMVSCTMLTSCSLLIQRQIVLSSQSNIDSIDSKNKTFYILPQKAKKTKSITDINIENVIKSVMKNNGWTETNKNNAKYTVTYTTLDTSYSGTSYTPTYGETTISSIDSYGTTKGTANTDYIGNNAYTDYDYSTNTSYNLNYNYGITGYTPYLWTKQFKGLGIKIINKKNEEVYNGALAVDDYSSISDVDLIAYFQSIFANDLENTYGQNQHYYCYMNTPTNASCKKLSFWF